VTPGAASEGAAGGAPGDDPGAAPELSVVIGFRDWGIERLAAVVERHLRRAPLRVEVVVSDWGSRDPAAARRAVEGAGGRVVRTEAAGPWSRAAALNAGVEAAGAAVVATTDADILCAPGTYAAAVRQVAAAPEALHLVQCRDLPPEAAAAALAEPFDLDRLRGLSTLRPRWGMGGFAAFTRRAFFLVNGYDERMTLWGQEDNDFARRFRLMGMPLRWIVAPEAAIFHLWHPPSAAAAGEAGRQAVARNRRILREDPAPVRNLRRRFARAEPLATVAIPTAGRPERLARALASCLAQSFGNFEALVLDRDGPGGGPAAAVAACGDPRLRRVAAPGAGPGPARDRAAALARGRFLVLLAEDDILVSTALEDHLAALTGGAAGVTGGWLETDAASGRAIRLDPGPPAGPEALRAAAPARLPCLMLDLRLRRAFPCGAARAGCPEAALALALARHGLRLNAAGRIGLLRPRLAPAGAAPGTAPGAAPETGSASETVPAAAADWPAWSNAAAAAAELALYGLPAPAWPQAPPGRGREAAAFDPGWYLAAYPDVALSGLDPLEHYLRYGAPLGRAPGPGLAAADR